MFPNKMLKSNVVRALILIAVAVVVIVVLKKTQPTSKYAVKEKMYAPTSGAPAPKGVATPKSASDCEMKAGTGLASSLLPREVASQEEFGEFAPEDVLAGQNFLEPRSQIGLPETTGGALRNANQSIRAEPPNPKEAFMWNNSTISTDTMQRPLV